MTQSRPLVSILIPAYNAEQWVRQAIESSLGQTYGHVEVIVVDDGSSDRTSEVVQAFGVRVHFEQSAHQGANAVRNRLIELAKGEWLQFLDADDYLLPDKIARQMELVGPDVDVVYSPLNLYWEDTRRESTSTIDCTADVYTHFIGWTAFSTIGVLLRRIVVVAHGGWLVGQPVCQEHELLLRLIVSGCRFACLNYAGAVYRQHSTNTISRRNPLNTIRIRFALTARLKQYLEDQRLLKSQHRKALFEVYLQGGRSSWVLDHQFAIELAALAEEYGTWWISGNPALPLTFQLMRLVFGFQATQTIADVFRSAGVFRRA